MSNQAINKPNTCPPTGATELWGPVDICGSSWELHRCHLSRVWGVGTCSWQGCAVSSYLLCDLDWPPCLFRSLCPCLYSVISSRNHTQVALGIS